MNIKKYFKKQSRSIQFRFLATVIFAMLAITVFIGGLSIYEVDNYIQDQAKNFVKVTATNEASKINGSLRNMEKSVKIMESYLMDFFTNDVDIKDSAFQEKVIKSADQMFIDVVSHTSTNGAVSYYFRFDPAISDSKSGLFYSKPNGNGEFSSFELTDLSIYEKDDTEHVGWFWQPYEAGKPIWMKPYYNQNNDILMISYVMPMYYEKQFIGVVGMDFDYMFLADQVHKIQIYENGFAHLEIDGVVICNDSSSPELDTNVISEKYMHVSEDLVNGMTLVLSANYNDIRRIRYDIAFKILFAVSILSVLFIVLVILIVKKIVNPLNKLTDASVKLANGDYDVEIVHSDTREIKILSTAFENMAMKLRERVETLHTSANQDALTGLRNTTSYKTFVAEFNNKIELNNSDFGVVVFDANFLKETNDKYGHDMGDKLIIKTANVISSIFKRSPVFRIGGDEFVAILQNEDLENHKTLFSKLDLTCANTFIENNDVKIPVNIARGFARFDSTKDSQFIDVFKRADDDMYENKRKMKTTLV